MSVARALFGPAPWSHKTLSFAFCFARTDEPQLPPHRAPTRISNGSPIGKGGDSRGIQQAADRSRGNCNRDDPKHEVQWSSRCPRTERSDSQQFRLRRLVIPNGEVPGGIVNRSPWPFHFTPRALDWKQSVSTLPVGPLGFSVFPSGDTVRPSEDYRLRNLRARTKTNPLFLAPTRTDPMAEQADVSHTGG